MWWPGTVFLMLLGILLFAGCAKRGGVVARPDGERTSAAIGLEDGLESFVGATTKLETFADIEVILPGGVRHVQAAIILERPLNLRIDLIDDLVGVFANIGIDDGNLWLYIADGEKLYTGESARRGLARITGLSLSASELISILSGAPPITDESILLEFSDKSSFAFDDGAFRLWTDGKKGRLAGFEKVSKRRGYRVDLSDYRHIRGVWFPCKISVSMSRGGAVLALRYSNPDIGRHVEGDPFSPPTP